MSKNGQWQLDGNAAELYERYVARHILGPWVPGLLDRAGVRSGEQVLDVACGTGALPGSLQNGSAHRAVSPVSI